MNCLKCSSEWSSTNFNKNTCPFCGELFDCDDISESDTIDEIKNQQKVVIQFLSLILDVSHDMKVIVPAYQTDMD